MSKKYNKSAKDIAFEKERLKLLASIRERDKEIASLKIDNAKLQETIECLQRSIEQLEAELGVPYEELMDDIERRKRLDKALNSPFANILKGGFM